MVKAMVKQTQILKAAIINVQSNNSDSNNPSDAGSNPLDSSSSSPAPYSASSDAGGSKSVSKSYELEENLEKEEFIPSIFYVVLAVILLMVGIKPKRKILD